MTLDTVSDSPAQALYLSLGFEEAGRIPGYAIDPHGARAESTTLMFRRT
ncbi:acetyltransferase [Bordetella holmesii]|nr:acetyltransferase [Bordetella holmesii]AHV91615.1 putative acetyltransferase domain protein [Bordetella holmesii ATCC 51541]EXF88413.1 putative acetyltransferase domain protein [Bordetella holmesii 30539]KCV19232.1 toxin-antitoxin system, toxin component, GNAT domain protein [Bordetella holmesii CDC-H643-BH]UEB21584.1 acetyltransferase [Bordetella holmesii]